MRWQEFVDGYDWKARLIPTAIILSPLFCTLYYFFPAVLGHPLQMAGSSLVCLAFVYLVSMVLRDRGVRYARKFWEERGGMPSTRFGRMRDGFLSHDQKSRIQQAVLRRFGIRLMPMEEEYRYPALADRKIKDTFREIKEFLRRDGGCALVEKHGAEYGFARNLCGSRVIFVAQAVSGIVLCGFKGSWPHWRFSGGCWVNAVLLVLWVPFAWLVLPGMLVLSADAYAGRVWVTFLSMAETVAKKPSSGVNPADDQHRASGENN